MRVVSDWPSGERRVKKQDSDWLAGKLDQSNQEMGASDWLGDGVEVSDWLGGGVDVSDWLRGGVQVCDWLGGGVEVLDWLGGVEWCSDWLLKMSCDWPDCNLSVSFWTNERPTGGQRSTGHAWHAG